MTNLTLFEAATNHLYRYEEYPGDVPDRVNAMSNWEFLQAMSEALDVVLLQYVDRRLVQRRQNVEASLEARIAKLEAAIIHTAHTHG
jgi:hypothetical protein